HIKLSIGATLIGYRYAPRISELLADIYQTVSARFILPIIGLSAS
ncbi:15497_t:CDS:1, partial [Dentiscutata heterogama]